MFSYEACWAKDEEAKKVMKIAWDACQGDVMKGIDTIRT